MGAGIRRAMMVSTGPAFATWDPANKSSLITLTNGNLTASHSASGSWGGAKGTISKASGSGSFEVTYSALSSSAQLVIGIALSSTPVDGTTWTGSYWYYGARTGSNGGLYKDASTLMDGAVPRYTAGDIITVEYDADNDTILWRKNGVVVGVGTYATTNGTYFPFHSASLAQQTITNFGQSAFSGAITGGIDTGWV